MTWSPLLLFTCFCSAAVLAYDIQMGGFNCKIECKSDGEVCKNGQPIGETTSKVTPVAPPQANWDKPLPSPPPPSTSQAPPSPPPPPPAAGWNAGSGAAAGASATSLDSKPLGGNTGLASGAAGASGAGGAAAAGAAAAGGFRSGKNIKNGKGAKNGLRKNVKGKGQTQSNDNKKNEDDYEHEHDDHGHEHDEGDSPYINNANNRRGVQQQKPLKNMKKNNNFRSQNGL